MPDHIPDSWYYVHDDEIRIGQYVAIPPYKSSTDMGEITSWDGGWYVRIIGTSELTGPWDVTELVNANRDKTVRDTLSGYRYANGHDGHDG